MGGSAGANYYFFFFINYRPYIEWFDPHIAQHGQHIALCNVANTAKKWTNIKKIENIFFTFQGGFRPITNEKHFKAYLNGDDAS